MTEQGERTRSIYLVGQGMLWKRIGDRLRASLGAQLIHLSQEDYANLIETEFDKAKKLSDFVGIVIRLAFAMFAAFFFFQRWHNEPNWVLNSPYFAGGVCAGIISFALMGHVLMLSFHYFAKDLAGQKRRVMKMLVVVLAVLVSLATFVGIIMLTMELAAQMSAR